MSADVGRLFQAGPLTWTPPPFPATFGFTQFSYTSLLNTRARIPVTETESGIHTA